MKRRDFLTGLAASATISGPALAQDYVDSVIAQLKKQGFSAIRQERTLLGRVRIIATRGDGRREIIINPNNGEILRDLWTPGQEGDRTAEIIDDKPGGSSGKGADDDPEDDDGEGGGGDDNEDGGSSGDRDESDEESDSDETDSDEESDSDGED